MKLFRKALDYYRQLRNEERQKRMLITHKTDWSLLEKLIQKANDNPDLRIEIVLRTGDVIKIKTTHSNETNAPTFDGVYVVE